MDEWTQGYVVTFSKLGAPTFHNALKDERRNRVARYDKKGHGYWCGKKVANTFMKRDWNPALSYQALLDWYNDRVEKMRWVAEMDRLMPSSKGRYWYDRGAYTCRMCGCIVFDRNMHFREHMSTNMYSSKFAETVTCLFGGIGA
jgi:hypothetical protein